MAKGQRVSQTLFIGAHGLENGLAPAIRGTDKLGYRELSEIIHANISPLASPLEVVIGACESSAAAALWNALSQTRIGLLAAFRDRPTSQAVRYILIEFLMQGDQLLPGSRSIAGELVYLDEGVPRLRKIHPSIAIYHKGKKESLVDTDELPTEGAGSLSDVLHTEGNVNPGSLLGSLAFRAATLPDLGEKQEDFIGSKRSRIKIRTFGPHGQTKRKPVGR